VVDTHNPRPLYRQLADELAADIESGRIADGQILPIESYLEQAGRRSAR
jgi:DNA-binding GntR family transcriptional regulator